MSEEIEQLKRQLQSREYGPVEISTVKKGKVIFCIVLS